MKQALCLLSGGQDSTTALYWAKKQFESIEAISFDYKQRHRIEIKSAIKIAKLAGVGKHHIIKTDILKQIGNSALLSDKTSVSILGHHPLNKNLPVSFVPGRNLFFLTVAMMKAYSLDITNLVIGVSETDYSGYPDCRSETIQSLQNSFFLGTEIKFKIFTPLMHLSKKETVELAVSLPGCMEALKYSHTCYEGKIPPCGKCPACILREKGFNEAGVNDPII